MTRRTWILGAAFLAVTVAAAVIVGVAETSATNPANASTSQEPRVSLAQVQRTTLSATVPQDGTLTYQAEPDGSAYSVINQAHGAYTMLPAPGRVIHQGHILYRVNNSPVVLLYGRTPAYRTLTAGVNGPDVAELNKDLAALGYGTRAALIPTSASFGSATTAAVEKLQAALGETQSGTLALGQAVFEPTAVRVTSVPAQLGVGAQPGGIVLQGTSTSREVRVALDASQQTDVAVGDKVSITLPNNQTTPGVVSSVGTVASCPADSGGASSSTPGSRTDSCASANSGSSTTPTINVNVTPSDPAATDRWDQAPVQVGITTARVSNALVVPVTALLARPAGGYAVEVAGTRGSDHLVPVSLGLFDDADGLVQVTGSLGAGQNVVVAST